MIGESANARASTSAVTRICAYCIGVDGDLGHGGSVRAGASAP